MNEGAGTKTAAVAADIVIGNVSTAIEMDIVESGTGRGSIGRGSSGSCMGTGIGSRSAMVKERGSSTRRDRDDRCRDYGGAGGGGGGPPHVEREQHEEHRRDDDRCREFRRDDERGHHRGREEGSPAHRGGVGAEAVEHGKMLAVALCQRGGR